jgi:signal peptidase I
MRRAYRISVAAVTLVLGVLALAGLGLMLLLVTGTVKINSVGSSTMEPTLHCARPTRGCDATRKDRFFVLTRFASYGRGDIVTFEPPPKAQAVCRTAVAYVKRIIGLPGERIEIRIRNRVAIVYVDGRRLGEPYVVQNRRGGGPEKSFEVPQDHYYVMGDDRLRSCDSRLWGAVPRENLIGKVFMIYWPPQRISFP